MTDRELLDHAALRDLVMRYCRGIDRRDFALVRACYHDDAIDDHGGMFHGSADDYVVWVAEVLKAMECTLHSVSNSLFAVAGDYGFHDWMIRHVSLYKPAAQCEGAAGAARHLMQELERAFGCARIGAVRKTQIAIDNTDKCQIGKVMPFSDDLRSDDDVDFTGFDFVDHVAHLGQTWNEV